MSFGDAVKICLRKYADFNGRGRRSEYWWFYLFQVLVSLPFSLLFVVLYFAAFWPALQSAGQGRDPDAGDIEWSLLALGYGLLLLVSLATLLPSLAALTRRLHDMGQSGAWILLGFVGLGIVPIIMAFMDSQPGDNQWGPDPKAGQRFMPGAPGSAPTYAASPYAAYPPPPPSTRTLP